MYSFQPLGIVVDQTRLHTCLMPIPDRMLECPLAVGLHPEVAQVPAPRMDQSLQLEKKVLAFSSTRSTTAPVRDPSHFSWHFSGFFGIRTHHGAGAVDLCE